MTLAHFIAADRPNQAVPDDLLTPLSDQPRYSAMLPPDPLATMLLDVLHFGAAEVVVERIVDRPGQGPHRGDLGWQVQVLAPDSAGNQRRLNLLAYWMAPPADQDHHYQPDPSDSAIPAVFMLTGTLDGRPVDGVDAVLAPAALLGHDENGMAGPATALQHRPVHRQILNAFMAAVSRGWDTEIIRDPAHLGQEQCRFACYPRPGLNAGPAIGGALVCDTDLQLTSLTVRDGRVTETPGRQQTVARLTAGSAPYALPAVLNDRELTTRDYTTATGAYKDAHGAR